MVVRPLKSGFGICLPFDDFALGNGSQMLARAQLEGPGRDMAKGLKRSTLTGDNVESAETYTNANNLKT